MRLDLLTNSCRRLPKIIAQKGPTSMLAREINILIGMAMEALEDSVGRDTRERLKERRERKAAEAAKVQP